MGHQPILELYPWEPGICFQHPDAGAVQTTVVRELRTRLGNVEDIRACSSCIVAMEARREELALEAGVEYVPGHAGEPFTAD
ncbi:hypothetical protein ABZ438_08375 [Streptomyces sp. NPDC005786]|uniref:hypothetical protein n=1 Tax=Streptomyces sp. NPDC005786 TaxID=3154891 RepID=UPI0033D74240